MNLTKILFKKKYYYLLIVKAELIKNTSCYLPSFFSQETRVPISIVGESAGRATLMCDGSEDMPHFPVLLERLPGIRNRGLL